MNQLPQKSNAGVIVAGIVIVAIVIAASVVYLDTRQNMSPFGSSTTTAPPTVKVSGTLAPPYYPMGMGSSCGCEFSRIDFSDTLSRQNASAALSCVNFYGGPCTYSILLANMRSYLVTAPFEYEGHPGFICNGGTLYLSDRTFDSLTFNVNC